MRRFARGILRLAGWRVVGDVPRPKCVLIGAPHTSNWDFPLAILGLWALGVEARWVGKHTLFRRPFGWIMRRLGGIPLDRDRTRHFVREVVGWFEREPALCLVIAPEGTRSRREAWRTGFYWIAHGAGVPIGLGFLDFARKELGVGDVLVPTGDIEADFERLRAFYADKTGKHPEQLSPIRVRPPAPPDPSPPGGSLAD